MILTVLTDIENKDILNKIKEKFPELWAWIIDDDMLDTKGVLKISRIQKKYNITNCMIKKMIENVQNYIRGEEGELPKKFVKTRISKDKSRKRKIDRKVIKIHSL